MNKLILSLFLLLNITTAALAQDKKQQEVAAAVNRLKTAMIDADSVALKDLTADSLSYGHSGGHVEGQTEFIRKITSGKSDFVTIDLTDQTIRVSGDVAIVRHTLTATTNDGGKPGNVQLHVMLVWQLQHKHWKLVARQAVKTQH